VLEYLAIRVLFGACGLARISKRKKFCAIPPCSLKIIVDAAPAIMETKRCFIACAGYKCRPGVVFQGSVETVHSHA